MPGTEPTYGWPIAEGTDPAKQFPAAVDRPFKEMLAAQLSAVPPSAAIPAAAGWVALGSAVPTVTRQGKLAVINGVYQPTASTDMNTTRTLGTLPAGYFPKIQAIAACLLYGGTPSGYVVGKLTISAGAGTLTVNGNKTLATSEFVQVSVAYQIA